MKMEELLERHLDKLCHEMAFQSAGQLAGVINNLDGFTKERELSEDDERCVERSLSLLFPNDQRS